MIYEIFDCVTGETQGYRNGLESARDSRVWLGRHCFWAFRNGREIRTGPIPA